MSSDGSLLRKLVAELRAFVRFVQECLADQARLDAIRATLGLAVGQPADQGVAASSGNDPLAGYLDGEDLDPLVILDSLFEDSGTLKQRLVAAFGDETQLLALDLLASNYVAERHPKLYFHMQFWGWLADTTSQFGDGYTTTTVERGLSSVFNLLGLLIFGNQSPDRRLDTEADAQVISLPTLRLAAIVLLVLRIAKGNLFQDWAKQDLLDMLYGWDTVPGTRDPAFAAADDISRRMLSVRLDALRDRDDDLSTSFDMNIGLTLALVPKVHGGPGLFAMFSGGGDIDFPLVPNRLQARLEIDSPEVPLWLVPSGPKASLRPGKRAALTLRSPPAVGKSFLFAFPDTETLRFQVGEFSAQASVAEDGPRTDVALRRCRIMFDASKIDGFIGSLLPDRKTEVAFDVGTRYAPDAGWTLTGGITDFKSKKVPPAGTPPPKPPKAGDEDREPLPLLPGGEPSPSGLQRLIQIGKSLGPVRLDSLQIGLSGSASAPQRLDVTAGVSVSAHIGPVFARIDHVGLRASLARAQAPQPANLHFAQLDLGFLAPRAVGITVDAKAVKGGGFVFYDPDKQQYAGVLELEISRLVSVKAIGLIATRMPGGAKGYSMVLIITAEGFRPIRLPMGFALAGIGGLMAIHRTCSEEALREGLRTKTLDLILFPQDPVQNAPNILAALERVFPAQRGSYVLGPMLRITWGVPTIVTIDVALLIEWGVRDRFIILGRLSAILPNTDNDLLRLRMDVLGVFDFDQGTAAIDAVLVDSKLLDKFVLTGAMALRMRWSSPRSFALAVGGMHRSFTPPANFPKLERLALNLTTGSNPRLTCEAYFALTSNTVQFGAAAHLYAEGPMSFNVTGDAGYDVLITLSPFHFLAEFRASMQIRKGTRNLFKVKVEGALEGPRPLALRAKATFEILWWDISIRVNATLIGGQRPPLPPSVNALEQLLAALGDARNWHGELPAGQSRIVVLREATGSTGAATAIAVHPLATLAVRQTTVPLNTGPIDRFGDAPVSGERQFRIASVTINGTAEPPGGLQPLREDFAPAQFFEMPDERKLTSPSFVPMDAGVQIGSAQWVFRLDQCVDSPLEYETKIIDRSLAPQSPQRITTLDLHYQLPGAQLEQQARHGAAGRSALRREDPLLVDAPPPPRVKVALPAFVVIEATLGPVATLRTAAEASAAPRDFAAANAKAKRGRREQVVPAFEVAR